MFGLKVRLVMDVAEPQRAGVKAVFIRGSGTGKLPAQVCISLLPHLVWSGYSGGKMVLSGHKAKIPAGWPGSLLLQDIIKPLIPVKSNVLLFCLFKYLNDFIKVFTKAFL
ncbi:hypothetical protein M621_22945 [Serratia plymuthica S13]|uniref:Uncharacterized protein n=1 Tax=Serratia plymuthica S13 TaxID=1348660 RepID=S4YXU6_SERPL|nr:hypothetical protein M621_22945 [Serratia plymuthica S13]